MSKESFAEWLHSIDDYYIRSDELRRAEEKHNVSIHTGPVTVTGNEDGTTNVPHRDIRHAEWESTE